jgi:aspartate kinase
MKVFKFGGASVKDAAAVRNVAAILSQYQQQALVVVISAMGKTTNALERLTDAFYFKKEDTATILEEIRSYHLQILKELFPDNTHSIYDDIHNCFVELEWALEDEPTHDYDCEYDQIVSMGEILSTKIVAAYLNTSGISCTWTDARDIIKTDNTYREGKINWELTEESAQRLLHLNNTIILTQGFIGVTSENFTTTLGREGSDYTAAILAWCLNAESVT